MAYVFICYIHKPGVLTPEMRVITCDDASALPVAIEEKISIWPDFEMIEVYDANDEPILRFTKSANEIVS